MLSSASKLWNRDFWDQTLAKVGLQDAQSASRFQASIDHIQTLEASVRSLDQDQLRERILNLRARAESEEGFSEALIEQTFTLVRESAWRTLGMRAYDVQVMAGLALAKGTIAEMATGEGKTLVAAFPAVLFALKGKGVHVTTVNKYLAERDCDLMRPVYEQLGLSVAFLPESGAPKEKKREAYAADITYGTGYEFGFDYLRDQLTILKHPRQRLGERFQSALLEQALVTAPQTQRSSAFAIVDEVDSVLIDEALTPLIISTSSSGPHPQPEPYRWAQKVAEDLAVEHYDLDQRQRSLKLTLEGLKVVYEREDKRIRSQFKRAAHHYVEQALKARYLFQLDRHYLIRKDKIEIIDEFTGRSFADRKWREGLHQAVETKEGVVIGEESNSDVSISRQTFYAMYPKLCGMTGTAKESAAELQDVYSLPFVTIPRNKPSLLTILPDRIFSDWESKVKAMVREIEERHAKGQPILVGTRTVKNSEELADLLRVAGLMIRVLNARQDKDEALLIGEAGQFGRITISTNMAGRGADIRLGEGAADSGGLHVIGHEAHESRRIDRQLIGRAGRQGEPGSAQFFLCADDDLVQHYAPDVGVYLKKKGTGELPTELALEIRSVQGMVEEELAHQRAQTMKMDQWMNKLKKHF